MKFKPLHDKDTTELKRAISKIKKTVEAINGDVLGMDDGWLLAVPQFVRIAKGKPNELDRMKEVQRYGFTRSEINVALKRLEDGGFLKKE